jgi:hypothetical protein
MADRQRTGQSLFLPLAPGRRYRTTSAGLVLPDQSWTAARLGLVPIPEPNAWIGELTGAYLIASEYLAPCEAARGREFDRGGWTSALLALHPRDEYIYHLAALNHATNDMALLEAYQDRFMERVAPDVAKVARVALAGGIDGQRRRFLARQVVLLALRLVLVPPDPAQAADASLASGLANLDPETAAILLAHLAADSITQQRAADEPRFGGTAQSLAMEVIASHLFNERDDPGDLLARYRLLWTRYGSQLKGVQLRRQPVELLEEATGLEFDDLTALGFAYYAAGLTYRPDTLVAVNAFANIAIGRPVIEQFLGLFSSTADELAEALRDCQLPWQMLPLAERPLLRAGDNAIVLDERYLLDRVTRGLYWPVHDQDKQHGEQARVLWTQAYGEMIENRAEDQLRQLAPPLVIPGASTFFTEEDLQRSFPSSKNTDAGIDFGADGVLAEIVSATVTVATRQTPDAASWRKDVEKIVMKKARQLHATAVNLLADPQPAGSPLCAPARRVFPVVVCGGQFPVNPITLRDVRRQLAAEGLLGDGRIQPLVLLDLEELEACNALHETRHITMPELISDWQQSAYREASFRSYLSSCYGGQNIGRSAELRAALTSSTTIMQNRLGLKPDATDVPVAAQDR